MFKIIKLLCKCTEQKLLFIGFRIFQIIMRSIGDLQILRNNWEKVESTCPAITFAVNRTAEDPGRIVRVFVYFFIYKCDQ